LRHLGLREVGTVGRRTRLLPPRLRDNGAGQGHRLRRSGCGTAGPKQQSLRLNRLRLTTLKAGLCFRPEVNCSILWKNDWHLIVSTEDLALFHSHLMLPQ
jgi:hypothetical protein